MKKILALLLVLFISLSLFASDEYSVVIGRKRSNQTFNHHFFSMEAKVDKFSFALMENGGDYLGIDTSYESDFSSYFHWNTGATLNYFTAGALSLLIKGNINVDYGTESVYLNLGVGVQGGVLKYSELDRILFSLSPLSNIEVNLKAGRNTFSFGMMLDFKYERQFKAVESFYFNARRDFSSYFAFSAEVWGRGAEYLMDPWLNFQSYGVIMKFTLKDGKSL